MIPTPLQYGYLSILPKDTVSFTCDNTRGIYINSHIVNIINKILGKRISDHIQTTVSKYQGGYKNSSSCDLFLFIFIYICSKYIYLKQPLYINTLDIRKALDS